MFALKIRSVDSDGGSIETIVESHEIHHITTTKNSIDENEIEIRFNDESYKNIEFRSGSLIRVFTRESTEDFTDLNVFSEYYSRQLISDYYDRQSK